MTSEKDNSAADHLAPEDAPAMRDGLLPCPWPACEGFADVKSDMPPFYVQCRTCECQGPHCETEDEATQAWNKRSVGSAPPANPDGSMNPISSNPLPQDAGRETREALRRMLEVFDQGHDSYGGAEHDTCKFAREVLSRHRPAPNKGEG